MQKVIQKGDLSGLASEVILRMADHGEAPVWTEGDWWVWGGTHWAKRHEHAVRRDLITAGQWARWSDGEPIKPSDSMVNSVVRMAESLAFFPGFFEEGERGISFTNGFLKLDQYGRATLAPHHADQRSRFCHDFDWDPGAQCPRWESFLRDVWTTPDDIPVDDPRHVSDFDQRVDFLARFVGASMFGVATEGQRALLLTGSGANGKSILCEVVRSLFPAEVVTSVPPHDLRTPERIARLSGANLNVVADISERGLYETGPLKQVISGDHLDGRRLYSQSFTFKPIAGHMFSANQLPGTRDFSQGFTRRWVVLNFPAQFRGAKAIPAGDLIRGLLEERSGIVAWCVRGLERFMADRRYIIPDTSEKAVANWRLSNDQVACFLDERTERIDDRTVGAYTSQLYMEYKGWCAASGHREVSVRTFADRLRALGYDERRMSAGKQWNIIIRRNHD